MLLIYKKKSRCILMLGHLEKKMFRAVTNYFFIYGEEVSNGDTAFQHAL